jgi:hypothetical protein
MGSRTNRPPRCPGAGPDDRAALAGPLWPRLFMIEDARQQWAVDVFALMAEKGYRVAARTKLNVVLRI